MTAIELLVQAERAHDETYEIQWLDDEQWMTVTKRGYDGRRVTVRYRTFRRARENLPTSPGDYRITSLRTGTVAWEGTA